MKGVILAGGTGSRLRPFTQIINKHLLPVGPYPMIYWPIFKLRDAGIYEIIIITNKNDLNSFLKILGDGKELDIKLSYEIQKNKGGGIADSLMCAKDFIENEKFITILGDNIFEESLTPYIQAFQKQDKGARVLLKEVKDLSRYGVPHLDDNMKRIKSIIEKPANPPSSFCVTGIYMYDKKVFQLIDAINPSNRNELEITDVNNLYAKKNELQYDILKGWWIDAGTHVSLYKAFQYVNEYKLEDDTY
ncbi:sugar phosphate nucleotidyltransferase [Cytobacillus sp. NJ13]|nr:sugar phosphate nucleotidyltransferase [Cytobacillus sp. NJ13]